MSDVAIEPFDALYRASDDPWATETRWYEERKRALLVAALPHRRYRTAYEAGCGNGTLTRALAARCDAVLASDASSEAVRIARKRLKAIANVRIVKHLLPLEWPPRVFDLIVMSEVVYFLEDDAIDLVGSHARASVDADGVVVACDWRAPIDGFDHTGEEAHRRFGQALTLPMLFEYVDTDFVLSGWSANQRSVAAREGLPS